MSESFYRLWVRASSLSSRLFHADEAEPYSAWHQSLAVWDETERQFVALRPHPMWLDPERRQLIREALELDPMPPAAR